MTKQLICYISKLLLIIVGLTSYIWTALIVYKMAGLFWLIIGFLCASVGIFPIAIFASVQKSSWLDLAVVVGGIFLFALLRSINKNLSSSYETPL